MELVCQGFVNVRNVNLADGADLQQLLRGKKQGNWGGPWQTCELKPNAELLGRPDSRSGLLFARD